MNKSKFFIAIGPPKTGTTWLYANLNAHPEVSLPRDKEIRYFWSQEYLGKGNFLTNLFGKHWHYRGKRRKFKTSVKQHVARLLQGKKVSLHNLKWDLRYFLGTQDDRWYERLFVDGVSGDITPKYCELSPTSIKHIKDLIPDCKIIISLRDPIDREWSRVKMNLLKHKNRGRISDVADAEVLKHFSDPAQHMANDYTALLAKWRKYFTDENIFLFYYEELLHNPQGLFDRICDFLNISRQHVPDIGRKRNRGISEGIPPHLLDGLLSLNYPFIERFAEAHPSEYSESWLKKYRQIENYTNQNG